MLIAFLSSLLKTYSSVKRVMLRSSNDLVHPIVVWVVTKWSKVKTTATTTAGALMRDAADEMPTVYRDTAAELSRHQPM